MYKKKKSLKNNRKILKNISALDIRFKIKIEIQKYYISLSQFIEQKFEGNKITTKKEEKNRTVCFTNTNSQYILSTT